MHWLSRIFTSLTTLLVSLLFVSVATALPMTSTGKGLLNTQAGDALALSSENMLKGLIKKAGYGLRIGYGRHGYGHRYYPRHYGYRSYGYYPSYRSRYRSRYYRPHKYSRYRYKRRYNRRYKKRRALRRLRRLLRHRLYY